MPDMFPYLEWLQGTWLSTLIRDTKWSYPVIEMAHLFGIVTLVGTTLALDLRLMNRWLRPWPVSLLMRRLLPWSWGAFVVMVLTGASLFISDPLRFYYNPSFQLKMALIVLAGLNAFVFQITALRTLGRWDLGADTPWGAKMAGLCSIVLWFGIVAAGRWIAFV